MKESEAGMRRRVVVTGMGAITPIGNSVEEFWNAVREEKNRIWGNHALTHLDINAIWQRK